MSCAVYENNSLYVEQVNLADIVKRYGTPCYVYSKDSITQNWLHFDRAFKNVSHQICYAVKANSNLAILNLLANLGSGFDIVSLGELERVIAAQGDVNKIIFSGVGKTSFEIERAINLKIFCFDIESKAELIRLNKIAGKLNQKVNVALRINPNVAAKTHAHISTGLKENKFGIPSEQVPEIAQLLAELSHVVLVGLACHIGSQLLDIQPFLQAADELLSQYDFLKKQGFNIRYLNAGGGLGIQYHHENPPAIVEYAQALEEKLKDYPLQLILEPGRAIVGNAGVLLTTVEYLKLDHKNFAVVDAGMNDFMRPALYDAWHNIIPLQPRDGAKQRYDIVGPVCESSDYLGKDRDLCIAAGDILAIEDTGAYGFSMSSNYNSRVRVAEVMVDGTNFSLIRRRETIADLMQLEELA